MRRSLTSNSHKIAQAHLLDAIIASIILMLFTITSMAILSRPPSFTPHSPPDDVLAVLAQDPSFIKAVYSLDSESLSSHVKAVIGNRPFKLAIYNASNYELLLRIGSDIEGVASIVELSGCEGKVEPIIVSLVVGS